MPRYLSLHTLACLTRQGAEELAERLAAASGVTARRAMFNMVEGKMVVEFEAESREALVEWLGRAGFHYAWLMRIEYESTSGKLEPM